MTLKYYLIIILYQIQRVLSSTAPDFVAPGRKKYAVRAICIDFLVGICYTENEKERGALVRSEEYE